MVVTERLAARDTGATQDRTGSPSICTVQAPHRAMPQPYLVPVSCKLSRSTQSSGVDGSSSKLAALPLTWNVITCSSQFRKSICYRVDTLHPQELQKKFWGRIYTTTGGLLVNKRRSCNRPIA